MTKPWNGSLNKNYRWMGDEKMLIKKRYAKVVEPEFLLHLSDGSKKSLKIASGLMLRDYGSLENAKEAMNKYYASKIRDFMIKKEKILTKIENSQSTSRIEKLLAEIEESKQKVFESSRNHAEYLRRIREIESIDKLF